MANEHRSNDLLIGHQLQHLVGGRRSGERTDPQGVEEVRHESNRNLDKGRLMLPRCRPPPLDDEDEGEGREDNQQRGFHARSPPSQAGLFVASWPHAPHCTC